MNVDIVDVEHGACAFIVPPSGGRLAMVDCGHNATKKWWPSIHLKYALERTALDYLFITNADHDHYSDLRDVVDAMPIHRFYRSWRFTADQFLEMKKESGPLSDDAIAYHDLMNSHSYTEAATPLFNDGMGRIKEKSFCN